LTIRDTALELGYIDALPVTGHPFDVWRNRLMSIPLGKVMSFEHNNNPGTKSLNTRNDMISTRF